jgi:hypothetical protein
MNLYGRLHFPGPEPDSLHLYRNFTPNIEPLRKAYHLLNALLPI